MQTIRIADQTLTSAGDAFISGQTGLSLSAPTPPALILTSPLRPRPPRPPLFSSERLAVSFRRSPLNSPFIIFLKCLSLSLASRCPLTRPLVVSPGGPASMVVRVAGYPPPSPFTPWTRLSLSPLLSQYVCLSLSLSLSVYVCASVSVSLSLSLCLCLSFCLPSVALCVCVCVCVCVCLSLSLSLCLRVSLCLSLSLSISLSVSLCSLYLSTALYPSLSASVSVCLFM